MIFRFRERDFPVDEWVDIRAHMRTWGPFVLQEVWIGDRHKRRIWLRRGRGRQMAWYGPTTAYRSDDSMADTQREP